jgi:hypothetical protein
MALIECPECGGSASDSASSCPHCGYSQANEDTGLVIWVVLGGMGVVILILMIGRWWNGFGFSLP